MPKEEQQEKVPWERIRFTTGLVGEGSADTGTKEAAAHGGKHLLKVKALSLLLAKPRAPGAKSSLEKGRITSYLSCSPAIITSAL